MDLNTLLVGVWNSDTVSVSVTNVAEGLSVIVLVVVVVRGACKLVLPLLLLPLTLSSGFGESLLVLGAATALPRSSGVG